MKDTIYSKNPKNTDIKRQTPIRRGKFEDLLVSFDERGVPISQVYLKKHPRATDPALPNPHIQDNSTFLKPSDGHFMPPTNWNPEHDRS